MSKIGEYLSFLLTGLTPRETSAVDKKGEVACDSLSVLRLGKKSVILIQYFV